MTRWLIFILCLLAGGLNACSPPPSPPPLRVGVNPRVGYDPLVLAREQGLLDPVRVRVVELGSNNESIRSLRNGVLEAAALTLGETLRLADEGVMLKIVAVLDTSHGADAVVARPAVASPADLLGRRIAVESSAVGALMLSRLLAAGGLRFDQVEVVRVEAAQHENILDSGLVEAVITFEPMRSRLVAGGAHVIFDSRQMPDEIIDVLAVRAGVLDERRDDVVELLASWERGRRALQEDPVGAAALLAPGTGLSTAEYLAAFEGLTLKGLDDIDRLLPGVPQAEADGVHQALIDNLLERQLIRRRPDWASLIEPAPARDALGLLAGRP